MFSVPFSSDEEGSSSQTTRSYLHVDQRESSQSLRTLSVTSTLRKRANALRAENTRLKREMQAMQTRSEDCTGHHRKQPDDCERVIDEEHGILNGEFNALKEETLHVFVSGDGDVEIADRALAYLEKVTNTFHRQLSRINSMDSPTQKHRTQLLERLKKLFERNVRRTDEWISLVIKAQ